MGRGIESGVGNVVGAGLFSCCFLCGRRYLFIFRFSFFSFSPFSAAISRTGDMVSILILKLFIHITHLTHPTLCTSIPQIKSSRRV